MVPAFCDDEPLRALAGLDDAAQAIPHDARPQLRELVRRVAAREHVEDALELRPAQRRVGRGAAREGVELVHLPLAERDHRRELLGEDVEGVLGDARLLDRALLHRLRDRGARQEISPVLREDDAARDPSHLVAGAADPLHPARDRRAGLDLDDEVHRAHVDPELERGGGDERGQAAGLERVLDLEPLLAGDRAVVGTGDLLPRQLVEGGGEALGQPPGVHEEDRRAVRAHELEETRVDRGPDRAAPRDAGRPLGDLVRPTARWLPRGGPCPRPAPRPAGRTPSSRRRPRSSPAAASTFAGPRRRRGSGPPPRGAAASRRGRCAGGAGGRPPRAARGSARGAPRASSPPARGSRPRSPCRPTRGSRAPAR